MTATCAEVRVALSLWDIRLDLPERLATHLSACPACRSAFDVRFAVVPVPAATIDPAVRARLLGPHRRPLAPLLLAAAVLVGLGLGLVPGPHAEGAVVCEDPSSSAYACEDVAFGEPLDDECASG